ncbi:MAG: phage baseplate assembly protein, partial [Alphaproteobacteria bacterium]|nr:phage baseplate assembly protein [Alphaproteobacteria bacterium]
LTFHGLVSHPKIDSDCLILCPGGRRDRAVVVAVRPKSIPVNAQPAEIALYCANGSYIAIMPDGRIDIKGKSLSIASEGETKISCVSAKIDCASADIAASNGLKITAGTDLTFKAATLKFDGLASFTAPPSMPGFAMAAAPGGGLATISGSANMNFTGSTLTLNGVNIGDHKHGFTDSRGDSGTTRSPQ